MCKYFVCTSLADLMAQAYRPFFGGRRVWGTNYGYPPAVVPTATKTMTIGDEHGWFRVVVGERSSTIRANTTLTKTPQRLL